MHLDGLRGRHSVHRAHLTQVGTILSAIAHWNYHLMRPWEYPLIKPLEASPQNRFHFLVPQPKCIKLDQQRAIRRMKIPKAFNGFQLQQPQQLPDPFIRLERDLRLYRPSFSSAFSILSLEINQQRLIARQFESRAFARLHVHARESIPHAAVAPVGQEFLRSSSAARLQRIPQKRSWSLRSPALAQLCHRLVPGACTQQFHPAAHSVLVVSPEPIGTHRGPLTTAPPVNRSRRVVSRRGTVPSAHRYRTHPPSRAHSQRRHQAVPPDNRAGRGASPAPEARRVWQRHRHQEGVGCKYRGAENVLN